MAYFPRYVVACHVRHTGVLETAKDIINLFRPSGPFILVFEPFRRYIPRGIFSEGR